MLFETLKQSYLFLGAIYFGLILGIVYEILIFFFKNKNKFFSIAKDLIFSLLATFLFITCLKLVNYGEFRFFILIAFIVGFIIERLTIGFIVSKTIEFTCKFLKLVYNKLMKNKFLKRCLKGDGRTSEKNI